MDAEGTHDILLFPVELWYWGMGWHFVRAVAHVNNPYRLLQATLINSISDPKIRK